MKEKKMLQYLFNMLIAVFLSGGVASAQTRAWRSDGSYDPYAYQQAREQEKNKQFQKSMNEAAGKTNKSSSKSKSDPAVAALKKTIKADPDNFSCISGNCVNGYGTWQYTPTIKTYKYIGQWKDGKCSGQGQVIDWEGTVVYDGSWLNGNMEGLGKYVSYDQKKLDDPSRPGVYFNTTLYYVYEGAFKDNERHGKGKLVYYWKSQVEKIYEGDFVKNEYEGEGTFVQFFEGQLDKFYVGTWKKGLREGKGIDSTSFSGLYHGEFKDNKRNGEGAVYTTDYRRKDGAVILTYKGTWLDDKMDGKGSAYDDGKLVYEGEFKNDKRHGTGFVVNADGTKIKSNWVDGVKKE